MFEARLFYHLILFDAHRLFGLGSFEDFGPCLFDLSPRTVHERVIAGCVFAFHPRVIDAFLCGDLGMGHVVHGLNLSLTFERRWIERARATTYRLFRRELRFRRRLRDFDPGYEWRLPEGLPHRRVEIELRSRLLRHGWDGESLDRELSERGLLDPEGASRDGARNPRVFDRLEIYLDLLILGVCRTVSDDDEELRYRKTLSTPGRRVRIVIRARAPVADRWSAAVAAARARLGGLPEWAVAVLVVREAIETWQRHDPGRLPTERRILERDRYRCQAPGCTARRTLEVHHITYRSHGGSGCSTNLVTLCHAHHHHAQHRGTLRVSGRAPHALTWEVGLAPGRSPVWTFHGDRLVDRARPR